MLVTSIGTGDSKDAPPRQVYDVLKSVLVEKEKAEEKLKVYFNHKSMKFCPIQPFRGLLTPGNIFYRRGQYYEILEQVMSHATLQRVIWDIQHQ